MDALCRNCDCTLNSGFAYCPSCGQKTAVHRLTPHDLAHEGVHYFTHADKGIFQLLRDLAVKRGTVAREYIDGRRKKYFPPLSFFMLVAAIFVFMMTVGEPAEHVDVLKAHPELNTIADAEVRQNAIDSWTRKHNVDYFTSHYSNLFALCALPLTAFVFWLFYRKARYNFVEHLFAGMYMLGFCLLINALIILPIAHLTRQKGIGTILFFVLQFVYFTIFYIGFLGKTTIGQKFKVAGVTFAALFLWISFTSTLIATYIHNGFWGLL